VATILAELYDALKTAGAPDEQARKAAEAVAAYENRFAKIESELAVLKWMAGSNLAVCVGTLFLVVRLI
jgi:hypothetical protein